MNLNYIWIPFSIIVVSLALNKQNNAYDRKKELNILKFWSGLQARRWRSGFPREDQPPELYFNCILMFYGMKNA